MTKIAKKKGRTWEKKETKLWLILQEREITQRELFKVINERFPNQTISLDALNRFIAGERPNVQLHTIRRICVVLNLTPNDIIDYEEYFSN